MTNNYRPWRAGPFKIAVFFIHEEEGRGLCGKPVSVPRQWSRLNHRSTRKAFNVDNSVAAEHVTAFLMNRTRLLLVTTLEKDEEVLDMAGEATLMHFSGMAKREMGVSSEAVNSVCFTYYADFRALDELQKAGAREEVAESVVVLLCDPPYNVSSHRKLKNTSHNVLGPNYTDNFCDLAKSLKTSGGRDHVFCSAL